MYQAMYQALYIISFSTNPNVMSGYFRYLYISVENLLA